MKWHDVRGETLGQEESHRETGGEWEGKRLAKAAHEEHIIASLSANAIERYFLKKGHTVLKTEQNYGVDLVVFTHDAMGMSNAEIFLFSSKQRTRRDSRPMGLYTFSISVKDYHAWSNECMPVFLILYDAKSDRAYWQYVQGYFESNTGLRPKTNATSISVRLPVGNEFNEGTVEYARTRKEALLEN